VETRPRSNLPIAYICAGVLALTAVTAAAIGLLSHGTASGVQPVSMAPTFGTSQSGKGSQDRPEVALAGATGSGHASSDSKTENAAGQNNKSVGEKAAVGHTDKKPDGVKGAAISKPNKAKVIALLPGAGLPSHSVPAKAIDHKRITAIARARKLLQENLSKAEDQFMQKNWDWASHAFYTVLENDSDLRDKGVRGLNDSQIFLVRARIICCLLAEDQVSYIYSYLDPNISMLSDHNVNRGKIEEDVGKMPDVAQIWTAMARASRHASERETNTSEKNSTYLTWAETFYKAAVDTIDLHDPDVRKIRREYCKVIEDNGDKDKADRLRRQYHLFVLKSHGFGKKGKG
jgi:hypothetical protein